MNLIVKDITGKEQGELQVKFALVENGRGTQAVHDTVVAYRANRRMGTACTKTVGEVAGSNKKPWRQKGTGRARAGNVRSPVWSGGGVAFGPRPRDFSKKVNSKTKALALRKAFSERLKAGDVCVVTDLALETHKTKALDAILAKLGVDGTALLVDATVDEKLGLAARNLVGVDVATADFVNTYQVLRPDKLVITKSGFEKLENRLKA